jgi:hypothetical protein
MSDEILRAICAPDIFAIIVTPPSSHPTCLVALEFPSLAHITAASTPAVKVSFLPARILTALSPGSLLFFNPTCNFFAKYFADPKFLETYLLVQNILDVPQPDVQRVPVKSSWSEYCSERKKVSFSFVVLPALVDIPIVLVRSGAGAVGRLS